MLWRIPLVLLVFSYSLVLQAEHKVNMFLLEKGDIIHIRGNDEAKPDIYDRHGKKFKGGDVKGYFVVVENSPGSDTGVSQYLLIKIGETKIKKARKAYDVDRVYRDNNLVEIPGNYTNSSLRLGFAGHSLLVNKVGSVEVSQVDEGKSHKKNIITHAGSDNFNPGDVVFWRGEVVIILDVRLNIKNPAQPYKRVDKIKYRVINFVGPEQTILQTSKDKVFELGSTNTPNTEKPLYLGDVHLDPIDGVSDLDRAKIHAITSTQFISEAKKIHFVAPSCDSYLLDERVEDERSVRFVLKSFRGI